MPKPKKKGSENPGGFKPPKRNKTSAKTDFKPKKQDAPFEKKPRKPKDAPAEVVESAPAEPVVAAPLPQFSELGLSDPIYKAISEMGFEAPTPIQARAIPALLTGRDIIGQAQTGTGKTAAFALPLIQKLDPKVAKIQALVLAPTRELAIQVAGGIYDLSKHTGLKVTPVYGGQPIDRQFRALKSGPQIVVGTPGRVLDHLRRGSMSLADCAVGVLDEADEMMALGFAEDLEAILSELPESRQLAFFSATMPPKIISLTKKFLRNPEHISIEAKQRTVDTIEQTYYEVPKGKKLEALGRVLDMETPGATVVFCRTRQETHDLSEALRLRGYNAESLHGDMNQGERDLSVTGS